MSVFVKRKKGETFESFLRRFSKRLLHSGTIIQFKKIRFYQRPKSRNLRRRSALTRISKREKLEYEKRAGLVKEEPYGRFGRR